VLPGKCAEHVQARAGGDARAVEDRHADRHPNALLDTDQRDRQQA